MFFPRKQPQRCFTIKPNQNMAKYSKLWYMKKYHTANTAGSVVLLEVLDHFNLTVNHQSIPSSEDWKNQWYWMLMHKIFKITIHEKISHSKHRRQCMDCQKCLTTSISEPIISIKFRRLHKSSGTDYWCKIKPHK